ncbi:hypothetical protein OS242_04345, partial [Tumebacillus sp. DT12]
DTVAHHSEASFSFSRICTVVIISVNLWTGNSVSFWAFSIGRNTKRISEDINVSSEAFQNVASVLSSLASQLDQVNQLRQQAMQLENRIHSLQSELWGADEIRKDAIRDQIASLRYRMNDFDRNADYLENNSNKAAENAFEGISAMTNRLHFGDAASVPDKMADFFGDFWSNVQDKAREIRDEVEEAYGDVTDFFEEKYLEAQEGGAFGAFLGLLEGLGKYVYETLEVLAKQTPSYMLSHPGETFERASAIFKAVSHPNETKETIVKELKGIPYDLKVYWERDLVNGTSYTRMKAVGTGLGVLIEFFGTEGLGRLARVEKSLDDGLRLVDTDQDPVKNTTSNKVDKVEDQTDLSNSYTISDSISIRTISPVADSHIYDRVISLRQQLPSDLKRSGNFGYAQVSIENIKDEFFAHSGINEIGERGYDSLIGITLKPDPATFIAIETPDRLGKNYLRDRDTEYKILNEIALQLGEKTTASGSIKLYTDRKPCDSCSIIIQQFKDKYKNVDVEILYNSVEKPLFKRTENNQ